MKNSEVRIVPVAADCDRRRADPKNPTERMSAAATSRWSNLATDLSTESTKSIKPRPNQAQSSPIKPNRAISCLDAIQYQPPPPSTSSTPSMPSTKVGQIRNPQAAIRNFRQSQSKPVKVFSNRYRRATVISSATIYCGLPGQMHNQLRFATTPHTISAMPSAIPVKPRPISPIRPIRPIPQSAPSSEASAKEEIHNPKSATAPTPCGAPSATPQAFHLIPLVSTQFHLIPLPAERTK
jgi:hypothetical protein